MCAFANDFHNWGGGYIIIGVEEDNGQAVLPPHGILQHQLDGIQGEIIQLGHRITPNYFPITSPFVLDGQHILVLWCPAGDNRIYEAPTTLGLQAQRRPYIRVGSRSIIAQGENLRRLQELTARIPFDDRVNNRATIDDLDLGLIREYLQEIGSELFDESAEMNFRDLCRTMLIAKGPDEDIRPVNVGLLFFTQEPHRFFDRARIELVLHQDDSGRNFQEVVFEGPIHKQLRDALAYLRTNVIRESVVKIEGQVEAVRYHNYPFAAIEEALSNAVYHKSYEVGSPIEIQVFPDHMTILSYPGPVPPVNQQVLIDQRRVVAREYRNRRIGDFLKELGLTEGRGTGLPGIYAAMADNGSPEPSFQTDDATYFLVTLSARVQGITNQVSNQASSLKFNDLEDLIMYTNQEGNQEGSSAQSILSHQIHDRVYTLLNLVIEWKKRSEIFSGLGLSNQTKNKKKYLDPVIAAGWIKLKDPDNKTNRNQQYQITDSGNRLIEILKP